MIIYKHIRLDNNEVFYIGMGNKTRPYVNDNSRNKYWHNIVNKHGYRVEIIMENLSFDQAEQMEILLISQYGRKDQGMGNLVNQTDGGGGNDGLSDESMKKMRGPRNILCETDNQYIVDSIKEMGMMKFSKKMNISFATLKSYCEYENISYSYDYVTKIRLQKLKKMIEVNTGNHLSEETKRKIGEANSKPQTKVSCPYCKKDGGITNMKRYHFENCKNK